MSKSHKYTIEQEVQCGDCICPPPCGFLTSNNVYHMKEGQTEVGKIEEDSSFLCRCICLPCGRTSNNKITINGHHYTSEKGVRLGYICNWMCCSRPDVIVKKGDKVVGSVEMPCYPQFVCKMEVRCYKGEGRTENNLLYTIKKCACNCHSLFGKDCGCCLDAAKYLDFEIIAGPAANGKVGHLQKEHFGVVNECFTMADKYNVNFASEDDDEKAIFLSAVQFVDMLFFENNYYGVGSI